MSEDCRDARWYCFHATGDAAIAIHGIAEQGFEVFYPLVDAEVPTRRMAPRQPGKPRARVVETRTVPVFSGYGFVRFDVGADRWRPIASTRGVQQLFSVSPERPTPIRRGVVERMMGHAPAPAQGAAQMTAADMAAGDRVEVLLGALAGRFGAVVMADADRVRVLMTLFGRDTEVEVDRRHLRAA